MLLEGPSDLLVGGSELSVKEEKRKKERREKLIVLLFLGSKLMKKRISVADGVVFVYIIR